MKGSTNNTFEIVNWYSETVLICCFRKETYCDCSQMDMLGSASLVHAGLTDLSGLEGLGDHLSHHHHAAAAAHHHYYAQVIRHCIRTHNLPHGQ